MDYSKTLNLPQTSFPMKADLPNNEPNILKFWEDHSIYAKLRKNRLGKEKFILHDGPPYSNGPIHMGQALNKVLKDIAIKYRSSRGFDAPYVPGWDTHGLPNEIQAIKDYKLNRKEINPIELRKKCGESALHFLDIQKKQFMRLGVQGDWAHPYITLDHTYEAAIIRIFGLMARKGLIFRGLKPVYWCPVCETALAEAEIEYKDKRSPSIFVKFPLKDDISRLFPGWNGETYVLIWTTTPWTLPGNAAIALNPGASYALVNINKDGYIIAKELLDYVVSATGIGEYRIVGCVKGKELEGLHARHPFLERDSLVINEDYVVLDTESGGTGCVHTAPGHGQDDFEAGLKYSLPVFVPVDDRGYLTKDAGPFEGIYYEEANEKIIEHLGKSGHLHFRGTKEHSYPHCWRCRGPIIFRATKQWFVALDVDRLREKALDSINETKWIPSWGQERIYNMVKTRPDWCISRQRIWGVPIPTFYCETCHEAIFIPETIDHIEKIFLKEGADAWFIKDAGQLLPENFECPHCKGIEFTKEKDIFDVWFESGVSHEAVCALRESLQWPADLYLEGSDQHRGWFQLSLLPAIATRGRAPFRAVLTHGWILDEKGHTMHKSLGNAIDPMDLIKKYGADILRLFFASVDYTSDIRIYHESVMQVAEVYKKIRNTCRFMLGNLYDFDPSKERVKDSDLEEFDMWILDQKNALLKKVNEAYLDYQFHMVYYHLHNFCTIQLSSLYLDVLKDRLYVSAPESTHRRAAQGTLYEILKDITIAMYPVLSFTAEELWQNLFKSKENIESVQLAEWPKSAKKYLSDELEQKWNFYASLREHIYILIENLRKQKIIRQSLEARIDLYPDESNYAIISKDAGMLKRLFIVSQLVIHNPGGTPPENAVPLEPGSSIKMAGSPAVGMKCPRCWNYEEKINEDSEYPDICERCNKVMREMSGVAKGK